MTEGDLEAGDVHEVIILARELNRQRWNPEYVVIDVIIKTFCLHRLSNVTHELFQRWFDRKPFSIVFNLHKGENKIEDIIEVEDE